MPSPEQGASTKMRSKNAGKRGASAFGMALSTTALRTPMRSMLRERICARLGMGSLQQSRHQRGDLRALAAGRGTKVEHPLAGLGIERGDGGQGARLLHVKQAALVQRRQAGARVALDEIRALRPWDGRAEPLDGAGRRSVRAEEQVDAQRAGIRLIQRVKIRKKACFTEQALHLFFKFFRQWLHIT